MYFRLNFLPTQTGFSGSCAPESATNPIEHSHLYEPTVLLQTWLAPQASGDWHSSKSTKVTWYERCYDFFLSRKGRAKQTAYESKENQIQRILKNHDLCERCLRFPCCLNVGKVSFIWQSVPPLSFSTSRHQGGVKIFKEELPYSAR